MSFLNTGELGYHWGSFPTLPSVLYGQSTRTSTMQPGSVELPESMTMWKCWILLCGSLPGAKLISCSVLTGVVLGTLRPFRCHQGYSVGVLFSHHACWDVSQWLVAREEYFYPRWWDSHRMSSNWGQRGKGRAIPACSQRFLFDYLIKYHDFSICIVYHVFLLHCHCQWNTMYPFWSTSVPEQEHCSLPLATW